MTSTRPRSLIVLPWKGAVDTILLLPALELLVDALPYAEITIGHTKQEQEEVLRLAPLPVPRLRLEGWTAWSRGGWLRRPAKALQSLRHNLAVMRDFNQVVFLETERLVPRIWVRTALWARTRVLLHSIEEGYLTDNRSAYYQRAVAQLLNLSTAPATRLPRLVPLPEDRAFAETIIPRGALDNKAVVFLDLTAPSGLEGRGGWPFNEFVTLAGGLVRRGAYVLLPAQTDSEPEIIARITDPLPNHTRRLPAMTLGQTAALLARCTLYIGQDTLVSHLALGVGAPAVTIFGPTADEIYAGVNPLQTVVKNLSACPVVEGKSGIPCPGCQRFETSVTSPHGANPAPYPCLESIRPDSVLAAAEKLLDPRAPRGVTR